MRRRFKMLLLAITLCCVGTEAQLRVPRFQHLSVEDGLSQDIVTAIAQDELGFMWFGTEDGLNVYDGYSFSVFKHIAGDVTTLSGNSVSSLLADGRGHLWVAASGGLDIIDVGTRTIRHPAMPPTDGPLEVRSLCLAADSSVWIATTEGLFRVVNGIPKRPVFESTPLLEETWGLCAERPDQLWCITLGGLHHFRVHGDTVVSVNLPDSFRVLRGLLISSVYRDSRRTFWVCTGNTGVFRFDSALGVSRHYSPTSGNPSGPHEKSIRQVVEGSAGTLWFGTQAGLEMFDASTEQFMNVAQSPPSSTGFIGQRTYSLFVDRSGILWIGTYRGGINTYAPVRQKFRLFALAGKNGARDAYAFLETREGNILVGTDNGVFVARNRRGADSWVHLQQFGSDAIYALCQLRNGEVWVGMDGTIGNLAGTSGPRIRLPVRDPVRVLFEDRDGDIWIGTDTKGLYRLDRISGHLERWSPRGEPFGGGVWTIFQGHNGRLWLGTWTSKWFFEYDKSADSVIRYGPDQGADVISPGMSIRAIREDSVGSLWLGTWGSGVYRLDSATHTFRQFTEYDGLANDFVKSIELDRHGALWIGTERGLTWFDPAHIRFRTFVQRDGLQGNFFFSGASCKAHDGILYFGGPGGFVSFDPDSVPYNTSTPRVVITNFKVFDKPAPFPSPGAVGRPITLGLDQNFFSFEFVSLDFTDPLRNRYAYMLEGFDKTWVEAGSRRYAAYTHLDPGSYTFRVKGSNNDGIWNEEGASLAIVITPSFWMTWWFRFGVLAIIVLSAVALYRYRVHAILQVERLRQRIARDLHDDIGTNLSAIVLASELDPSTSGSRDANTALGEIRSVALVTQELMRDIVWMLNPRNDSPGLLIARMREEAMRLLRAIPHTFQAPSEELPREISLGLKRNIFLIYKESLHNILKHACAHAVTIAVTYAAGILDIMVQDDGIGFDPGTVARGNGLDSMAARAQQIGAGLTIDSRPGNGTSVHIRAKIT